MSWHENGGPAFPIPIAGCNDGGVYNTLQQSSGELGGMTLRDYFAAKAMAAMDLKWDAAYSQSDRQRDQPEMDARWVAIAAYRYADAMLAARGAA